MPEQIELCLAAGMNAHVGKPFSVDGLHEAISFVLKDSQPSETYDDASFAVAINRLRREYRATFPALGLQIKNYHDALEFAPEIAEIHALAHQIVGTAGALGMSHLSEVASAVLKSSVNGGNHRELDGSLSANIGKLESVLAHEAVSVDSILP